MSVNNRTQIPVVILCGGKGTRLREETDVKPKPMVDIGGRPILWHIMKSYSNYGFTRFVLALGFKADSIKNYFLNYRYAASDFTLKLNPNESPVVHQSHAEAGWTVTCVDTGLDTLKGARVKRLEPFLTADRFHLTYGDGLSDIDIGALDAFHVSKGREGTVSAVRPPSRFGEMLIEGDRVLQFEEKPQLTSGCINGGFFVFNRSFLSRLSADPKCDLEFGPLQKLAREGGLSVRKHEGFWQCMDNVRERDLLQNLYESGQAPWIT